MATWKRCIRKLFVEDICCAEKVKVEACCADLHFKRMSIFVALLLILIDGMLFGHVHKYLKYTKESTVMIIESNWATCHSVGLRKDWRLFTNKFSTQGASAPKGFFAGSGHSVVGSLSTSSVNLGALQVAEAYLQSILTLPNVQETASYGSNQQIG